LNVEGRLRIGGRVIGRNGIYSHTHNQIISKGSVAVSFYLLEGYLNAFEIEWKG
jgi:hypothetical protein